MQYDLNHLLNVLDIDGRPPEHLAIGAILAIAAIVIIGKGLAFLQDFTRRSYMLRSVPSAPDGNWLLGHVLPMVFCVNKGIGAWDQIAEWIIRKSPSKLIKFRILDTHAVAFSDPVGLKRVFQTHYKIYEKDLKLSYHPFLPILGTGLVRERPTSSGAA